MLWVQLIILTSNVRAAKWHACDENVCPLYRNDWSAANNFFFFFHKSWKPHLFAQGKDWTLKTYKHSFFSCSGCVCEQIEHLNYKRSFRLLPYRKTALKQWKHSPNSVVQHLKLLNTGYGCFSALKVPTSLRETPWSLHLWCFSVGLAVAHEPNEGLPHGPSVSAPPGTPDLAWWGFWSHSLVEPSNGSWPLVSKRKAFGLQPPTCSWIFYISSDESDKFSWLKIIFKNNKSICGIEEARGTTQSTFHFQHHGSRTAPYLVSKQQV